MSPNKHYPEVTPWSVLWGLVMAVIFKRGGRLSGPEGRSSIRGRHPDRYHRRRVVQRIQAEERLGENVIIQSIGASSGVDRSGGHFHLARPLYPARQISGDHGQFLRGFHEFLVRRYHRDLAINPVP